VLRSGAVHRPAAPHRNASGVNAPLGGEKEEAFKTDFYFAKCEML